MNKEQESVIDKALEVLDRIRTEDIARLNTGKSLFVLCKEEDADPDENDDWEYTYEFTCDESQCEQEHMECLMQTKPDYTNGKFLKIASTTNSCVEFDKVERCPQCGCPMNEFVEFIDQELDHFLDEYDWDGTITSEEATEIHAILFQCERKGDEERCLQLAQKVIKNASIEQP